MGFFKSPKFKMVKSPMFPPGGKKVGKSLITLLGSALFRNHLFNSYSEPNIMGIKGLQDEKRQVCNMKKFITINICFSLCEGFGARQGATEVPCFHFT